MTLMLPPSVCCSSERKTAATAAVLHVDVCCGFGPLETYFGEPNLMAPGCRSCGCWLLILGNCKKTAVLTVQPGYGH